jgi:hypothetical protein
MNQGKKKLLLEQAGSANAYTRDNSEYLSTLFTYVILGV